MAGTTAGDPVPADGREYVNPAATTLQWTAPSGTAASVVHYKIYFSDDDGQVSDTGGSAAYRGNVPAAGPLVYLVDHLDFNRTYYWRVDTVLSDASVLHGDVWRFTTEYIDIPGVVIDYSANPGSEYIGSPSIVKLPEGTYVASHDFFGPGTTYDQTAVFESRDQGTTWSQIGIIDGQFWSSLFWHKGTLYIMGVDGKYGHCVIRRSVDGGRSWTTPTDAASGRLFPDSSYHTAPMPILLHDGRIWRTMEDAQDPGGWGNHFRAFMMSAPVDADLLDADNWTSSNRLSHDAGAWTGTGWLEGNAVLDPEGEVVNILRVAGIAEKAAIVRVSENGETATFDPVNDFIDFYGGASKFTIRHDTVGGRYWSLVNKQADPIAQRNRLALVSSANLRHWSVEEMILEHSDTARHAWQYIDWLFEGDDIVFVSRTAYDDGQGGQAHNYHDANFMTFHRVKDFRGPRAPLFDVQPADEAVNMGQAASFRAVAHVEIVNWQWFKKADGGDTALQDGDDGGDVVVVSDGGQTTLTIENVATEDIGDYYCVAVNSRGATASRAASLRFYGRSMTAHWKLDETEVSEQVGGYGPVREDTGHQPDGVIWGYTEGMVNHAGPDEGADRAYDFSVDAGISGVATNTTDVIPERGDFSLVGRFRTGHYHSAQGHLFSNNNGQPGRANIYIQDGMISWWVHNGPHVTAANRVDDNQWHEVMVSRRGDVWKVYLDGEPAGTQTISCGIDQSTMWLIGRSRRYGFDFEGLIGDVRVYDYAVDGKPDLNNDGVVDLRDFSLFAAWWRGSGCRGCQGADLTLDEKVGMNDLYRFVPNWLSR